MSWNDEEKAVSAVSFISSSLWYIEDFSITNERKITYVSQRKQTKQTIGSFIAWISTEFSYISLLYRLLREYPQNIAMFRYCFKMCYFVCALSCLNSIVVYNDQFKYKCMLFFSGLEQSINRLCKRINK